MGMAPSKYPLSLPPFTLPWATEIRLVPEEPQRKGMLLRTLSRTSSDTASAQARTPWGLLLIEWTEIMTYHLTTGQN
jgi:hypothetical protein